ncbi:MAG: hypothetical protein KBF75_14925, partial [Saprospiraceae bacterium]|nr:hypothetical protein [Saprospiraceae bacterium]
KYLKLDNRISDTYAKATSATNKNSLYDSYIKAFRWSTDRLDPIHGGIIAFVSNGAWLDSNSSDGFRKVLEKEFSSIWVFNTRGNARTQGELRKKEAGNVFGAGSRTPIAITLLVRNPISRSKKATINYYDIGDYLNSTEKLTKIKEAKSVSAGNLVWKVLQPNEHGDWVSQRNDAFTMFVPLGDKEDKSNLNTFFVPYYSNGLKTQRDAWCYNCSQNKLSLNIQLHIDFYNEQLVKYSEAKASGSKTTLKDFVDRNSSKISWTRALEWDAEKNKIIDINDGCFMNAHYRPFYKQHLYFSKALNEMQYQIPKLFPKKGPGNLVICVSGIGASKDFSCIISNLLVDVQLQFNGQCFPLYYFEERKKATPGLFDVEGDTEYIRRDGISDFILARAYKQYGKNISKEDIFYYVYGFLHSPEYRANFTNDLTKMIPRLPLLDDVKQFWQLSKAGRKLADLHLDYESVPPCPGLKVTGEESNFFTVEKMRFPSKGQKDTIIFNSKILVSNIPAKAYEYLVNGKSAIEWIMERYQVTVHKESGIKNDPNDWAKEVGNPRYILDLLLSIINVSVQTVEIVEGLPKLTFE